MRYKAIIEYKGLGFSGWQRQADANSIQGKIESAFYRLFGKSVDLFVAGRTDAGVHAVGQVAHFELQNTKQMPMSQIVDALNFYLRPDPIAILKIKEVSDDFDARFSAKKRYYRYKILNRRAHLTIEKDLYWQVCKPLDILKIKEQIKFLTGQHDFNSFRSASCQAKNALRTLESADIIQNGDRIFFDFCAKSFLHNQVRIIVGTLVAIGCGRPYKIQDIFLAKNRKYAGPTAPPYGLYLMKVEY